MLEEQRLAHKVVVGTGWVTVKPKIPKNAPQILSRSKQKRRALPKGGARQVVKIEIRLWYFCGQMRNRRSFHCGDFQFWWT
ncbi:hypothetical protein [Flavonifractor sp. HCP28S3_F3]|uniref:hypothetical protein n=1 Tax=Flavonifractor sp. HCP28S3_F3 TaxID=3438939 RepID=UPI003F88CA4F